MNIDIECVALLSLILQDAPRENRFIVCILARSNAFPTKIKFHSNTEYPTFYGYSNERIPYYLMTKRVLSNIPRNGYAKRLISVNGLAVAEMLSNKVKNEDLDKIREGISKLVTLDNRTAYKEAEAFLIFKDKAQEFIRDYTQNHKDEIVAFLGPQLSAQLPFLSSNPTQVPSALPDDVKWSENPRIEGSKFIFDDKTWVEFNSSKDNHRFDAFKVMFDERGKWVPLKKLKTETGAGDIRRTVNQISEENLAGKENCKNISIEEKVIEGKAHRRICYQPPLQ